MHFNMKYKELSTMINQQKLWHYFRMNLSGKIQQNALQKNLPVI